MNINHPFWNTPFTPFYPFLPLLGKIRLVTIHPFWNTLFTPFYPFLPLLPLPPHPLSLRKGGGRGEKGGGWEEQENMKNQKG